jgi:hypothetical protein
MTPKSQNPERGPIPTDSSSALLQSHLRFGWWALLLYLTLGIVLEALHGFKIGWYLNVSSEMRRLLFTLAHAHGTLLALVNMAFSFAVAQLPGWDGTRRKVASSALKAATVLLPGGFFLGGVVIYHGDPGFGILLVPLGALFLLVAVLLCALAMTPASFRAMSDSSRPTTF